MNRLSDSDKTEFSKSASLERKPSVLKSVIRSESDDVNKLRKDMYGTAIVKGSKLHKV